LSLCCDKWGLPTLPHIEKKINRGMKNALWTYKSDWICLCSALPKTYSWKNMPKCTYRHRNFTRHACLHLRKELTM
jgi:hypothetical protein